MQDRCAEQKFIFTTATVVRETSCAASAPGSYDHLPAEGAQRSASTLCSTAFIKAVEAASQTTNPVAEALPGNHDEMTPDDLLPGDALNALIANDCLLVVSLPA